MPKLAADPPKEDAGDPDGFASLSILLTARRDWRHLSARTPDNFPVLIAPVGFGIDEDLRIVRRALESGRLTAYAAAAAKKLVIDAHVWRQDWAWNEILAHRPLGTKIGGREWVFRPIVRFDDFHALFPTPENIHHPRQFPGAQAATSNAQAQPGETNPPTVAVNGHGVRPTPWQGHLPPYLAFMVWVARELKLAENPVLKTALRTWLAVNWPPALREPSQRKIRTMATLLGNPDNERGGRQSHASRPSSKPVAAHPLLATVQVTPSEAFPPYLTFMLDVSSALSLQGRFSKKNVHAELKSRWPSELGPSTDEKIESMAMLLGDPAHEKGGLLPATQIHPPSQ